MISLTVNAEDGETGTNGRSVTRAMMQAVDLSAAAGVEEPAPAVTKTTRKKRTTK